MPIDSGYSNAYSDSLARTKLAFFCWASLSALGVVQLSLGALLGLPLLVCALGALVYWRREAQKARHYVNLIRGSTKRSAFFDNRRIPEFLGVLQIVLILNLTLYQKNSPIKRSDEIKELNTQLEQLRNEQIGFQNSLRDAQAKEKKARNELKKIAYPNLEEGELEKLLVGPKKTIRFNEGLVKSKQDNEGYWVYFKHVLSQKEQRTYRVVGDQFYVVLNGEKSFGKVAEGVSWLKLADLISRFGFVCEFDRSSNQLHLSRNKSPISN